jgi:thiol-disulfide isomerase/thioredoxin
MAIGAAAPAFSLPGVDGKNHKLADYSKAKVLAIVMESNHCAACQLYEARIEKMYQDYKAQGVAVVAINPDDPKAVKLEEEAFSEGGETLDDMKAHAEFRRIDWPYLYDGDKQAVAAALGATATPEIFVFDQARKLQYRGRIDDSLDAQAVKTSDARDAIDALLSGEPVPVATTDPAGCAIAWPADEAAVKAEREKMDAEPITVALASKADLTKLRSNPSGKMLLVNFWATWCGPCVGEFPDLQDTYRMFRGRGLDFVTVSENDPEEKASVLEFLQKQHGTSTNMMFSDSDVYAMQAAFDPNMAGAVPFTVLMAPNGDVLYQQVGDLDTLKLRHAILANLPDSKEYPGEQQYWGVDAGN